MDWVQETFTRNINTHRWLTQTGPTGDISSSKVIHEKVNGA